VAWVFGEKGGLGHSSEKFTRYMLQSEDIGCSFERGVYGTGNVPSSKAHNEHTNIRGVRTQWERSV
jgi:hypothetical protein